MGGNRLEETHSPYESVRAAPVKSFFVSMLTRDIKLEEAILDLLDNCVDGILRSKPLAIDKPYQGNWAEITFDKDTFAIFDNCGGIPWRLSEYAFRMGRDPKREPDGAGIVGVYGIGMKRAIFKMGRSCEISTRSGPDEYEVSITPEWIDDEDDWDIPAGPKDTSMVEDGTRIIVGSLHEAIRERFEDHDYFQSELVRLISTHYSLIIDKGFKVTVNGTVVQSRSRRLLFSETAAGSAPAIQPYIYRATTENNVEVFVSVGFTRPIPSQDEVINEQEEKRHSTEEAGWTVICNDRAVLYCDRSELTGWGEFTIPRYHTQFIAIAGTVEFRSDDPAKLPTTTTKRGVDASSLLYLQTKNKMREGMKLFTDYTNKWKGRQEDTKAQFAVGRPLSFTQLKDKALELPFRSVSRPLPGGSQFKPSLPKPPNSDGRRRRLSFLKDVDDVAVVAEHLFGNAKTKPSEVGEKCFDIILREANR